MITKWTSHLKDEEDKERFATSVMASKHVLDRLIQIIEEMEDDLDAAERSPKTYETPNWDYRQAHNNGAKQYLNIFKKIITLDQQEH